jgi:signal transduction histidine kinase
LYPVWFRGGSEWQLILLRTVHIKEEEEFIQGVWVDWPRLRHALLDRIKDRIPDADLEPMPDAGIESDRKLAGIPALLVAKAPPVVAVAGVTPTRVTLSIAWAGVIAAVMAIGLVLRAIIDLGERRGRFVSAVTHELRTPLTTFCLYSQMLADNMVREEPKRSEYLSTLKRESQRLAKIVENVLYFARLSEVRASVANEPVEGGEMLDRIVPVLARRASESGMTLDWDLEAARGAVVRADPQTLERILANLVENACKYAKDFARADGTIDNRVHLRTRAANGMLEIQVADHGPGIARGNRRRAFRAFNRTDDTSNTAPGLGLGLSLARGLARSLRGDLRIVGFGGEDGQGAVLSLTIPAEVGVGAGVLARA